MDHYFPHSFIPKMVKTYFHNRQLNSTITDHRTKYSEYLEQLFVRHHLASAFKM